MARAELIDQLERDEGFRSKAYPDPLSPRARTGKGSGAPWTIGFGHTGPEVVEGLVWTEAQCRAALIKDVEKHSAQLLRAMPWVATLDPVRQDVITNMAFNLGVAGLSKFTNTLRAVQVGDYERAAVGMLASRWAGQVGARAQRLARQMRTGVRC